MGASAGQGLPSVAVVNEGRGGVEEGRLDGLGLGFCTEAQGVGLADFVLELRDVHDRFEYVQVNIGVHVGQVDLHLAFLDLALGAAVGSVKLETFFRMTCVIETEEVVSSIFLALHFGGKVGLGGLQVGHRVDDVREEHLEPFCMGKLMCHVDFPF